ncbi:FAD-dependent oxidoreductase, partial [bacterium]
PLTSQAKATPALNPGGGWVSQLCHEPRISHGVLNAHLQPYFATGKLQVILNARPVNVVNEGNFVKSVDIALADGKSVKIKAPYFLDATELGELLELGNIESVIGAESKAQTGEPHALEEADPLDQQAISYCFVLSLHPGENHVIEKPQDYDFWRDYKADFWPDHNLGWGQTHPVTLETRHRSLFPVEGRDHWEALWPFRQILKPENFEAGFAPSMTLVNWPQIDYWLGPIIGVSPEEAAKHREAAKQLSLSFVYWMQTEAPRHDGGVGYPEIRLRGDVTGTLDGLAKYPYIRESRRILAEFTICEQHVSSELCPDGAVKFPDSVGIGCYRIDLHPTTALKNYLDVGSQPFQIPLGSLIPRRVENLLPACKNLGVTHITNGCYRLHPVEWNIGEAAGALAAFCLDQNELPRAVRNTPDLLNSFQKSLVEQGIELDWPGLHEV